MEKKNLEARIREWTFGPVWNLFLLTTGSWLIAFSVKAVALPNNLLTGGMSGLALLMHYVFTDVTTGEWFFLLNLPVFALGWLFVSRRFFLYSLYGMFAVSAFIELIDAALVFPDLWLAVITAGGMLGAGVGITLRSLGSTGGADILAVIFKERFNLSMGAFEFWFNFLVFLGAFACMDPHMVLYSLAMTFIISFAIEYVMSMFSERKMVIVISERPKDILDRILTTLDRGATILQGKGGFSGHDKEVILTMVSSIQLKQLEELVYNADPDAFTIVGSGFHVFGRGFSSRKIY
ncbi:YitT family protein [Pseudodesulfovibrio tunisiensis]|uniref:YitT family protein n=1 Tax=Pseudodesulfovibrio tunisiensis TaxID=463192 RepID=UPI001FB51402|nr:YitT family protein [Pseudodesulfovibrio tunisiensis]